MAYVLGQLFGVLILVAVVVGVVRTFTRRDLTLREKLVGGPKKSAPHAVVSTTLPKPGWYADPAGRAEMRWFDGTRWTGDVVSGGRQSREEARP